MALTGRTALIAALGALFVGLLLPSWVGIGAVTGAVLLAVLADLVLAAPVRSLRIVRGGATTVRLGDTASVELTVTNPSGRPLRALIRDAWAPSAWRPGTAETASRHTLAVPGGERRLAVSVLAPSRRGDHHAHRVTVRSLGPRSTAASTCPPGSPGCANSTAAPRC